MRRSHREGYETELTDDALAVLERLTAELAPTTPALDMRTSIAEGSPAEVLIEPSKGADLLVVAARGREAFAGMLLGSVNQHIVAHAERPVVVGR